jgi:hypothetical protein
VRGNDAGSFVVYTTNELTELVNKFNILIKEGNSGSGIFYVMIAQFLRTLRKKCATCATILREIRADCASCATIAPRLRQNFAVDLQ